MFTYLYNFYYGVEDKQRELAKEQIQFLHDRKASICEKCNMSGKERQDKLNRIDLTIDALRYTYSLYP